VQASRDLVLDMGTDDGSGGAPEVASAMEMMNDAQARDRGNTRRGTLFTTTTPKSQLVCCRAIEGLLPSTRLIHVSSMF
jgi:hypothetical protein